MRKLGLVLATLAALSFTMIPVSTQPARADGGVLLAIGAVWLLTCGLGHHHHHGKKGKRHRHHHHHGWCWHSH